MKLTQREKNRLAEHSGEGHKLTEGISNSTHVYGTEYMPGSARLYKCTCKWFGWMQPNLIP